MQTDTQAFDTIRNTLISCVPNTVNPISRIQAITSVILARVLACVPTARANIVQNHLMSVVRTINFWKLIRQSQNTVSDINMGMGGTMNILWTIVVKRLYNG